MTKSALRKLASQQRQTLSPEEVSVLSIRLLDRFKLFDFSEVDTVHLFIPISDKREPDTFIIIDWLKAHHPLIKVIIPRVDFDTFLMTNHSFIHKNQLSKNIFNILEPQQSEAHSGKIDMVLVPLLAFDRRGYRVGYGKGFYDRFLKGIETIKIGLSFFDAYDSIEDIDEYDIKLNYCLTPDKTYNFTDQDKI